MKHNYFNLNQNASKNDGQVPRNVQMSRYCPQPDSVSNPCRCRDLATPRVFSVVSSARAWKHVAMIFAVLVMSVANVGMAWGSIYATFSLSDMSYTSATLTYEKSSLSGDAQKLNKGERKVEVPCADASGTLYFNGTGANGDRYASIWGSNGTSYDASRQVSMPSGYGAGISFTSADIMTEGGKYYIIFGARKPSGYDDFKIAGFKYTLNSDCSASSGRSFEPGEIVYIKDIKIDGDACMKISGKNIWAVFVDEAGTSSDWAQGDLEKGSWNAEGAIYKMVVPARKNPAKKYVKVIFTRDDWAKQTVDLTTTEPNNLYNLSNNWSGGKLTGGSWGFYTPASKTVYFDNRNVSDWTTAYVRIGHGSWNNAWGAMTKVAGTRHLYTQSTSQWDNHTLFSIANTAGWTDGKNIYQPYEEGGNIKPNDEYKMSKQTNYQKYPIISDAYICPSETSVLERGCQYYKVNSSTSTSTFDNDNRLVPLPSYSVTYSGTNCSVTVVKYNNDAGSSTSALSSGSTVDPTRIIKVTVTPSTGYQFSEVEVTGAGTITAAASGTPGVYYVTDNATISATCTCIDFTPARGGTADGTYTVGEDGGTLTCSVAAAGDYTYKWKQYTLGQGVGDAVDAVGTGATSTSFTPHPTVAGTYYYFCEVTNSCSVKKTTSTSGTFVFNAAVTLYTVTYNVNGGGSVTPTSATQASSGAAITLATPSWSGYTIEGWYNNKTKLANAGASYTPTADITAYAHWTDNISGKVFSFIDNNYGDKFKGFDGSTWVSGNATGKSKTYTNGDGVQYSVSAGCWDSKSNAISSLAKFKNGTTSMSVVIPTGKKATVKILYGAYNKSNKLTVNEDEQTAPSTALTDEMTNAQVFAALKEITLSNQTGTLTLGSSTGNIYIARVSAVITGYTVSYDKGSADGASGSLASGTKTAGSSFTLSSSSSAFTRSGYTYDGWSVNEDGSTKDYNLGGSYTTDAPVTLYPHWVADASATITATKTSPNYVSTDPNNLVLSISTTGASSGWYYRVKNTGTSGYQTPDNTPYNTATWTMTSGLALGANNFVVELYNGSGEKQAESATITVTAETAYPMTIAAGAGGTVSPSGEIKANESSNHIHPEITATPASGYHFVNWTKNNENATLADASSATTTITNAIGACTITANFEADDACPTAASGEVVYKFVTKSSGLGTGNVCAATNTDYLLTTGDGNPLETLTGGTLTARTSNTSHLKYATNAISYANGGGGVLKVHLDCALKTGDVIRYISYSSSNSKYNYLRHTSNSTTSGQLTLAASTTAGTMQIVVVTSDFNNKDDVFIVSGSNTTAISYFEVIRPYTVTLDANTNGGKINGENTETHYMLSGESLVLPHATKSGGYRFKGWFTTSDGATQASTNYSPTGTTTLYAQFEDCPGSGTVYKWEVASGLTDGSLPVGVSGEAEMEANEGNYLSTLIGGTLTLHNKNNHIKISDNNKFSIDDNAPYIIVNLDCALEAGDKFVATVGSHTAYVTKTSSRASTVELPTGTKQETAVPAALEGASTLYIWRGSGNYKISYFEITRTSTTYTVSYDGNGGSGTAPTDGTAYARNAEVTVKDNTGSLAKSNYAALAYWNTKDDGTGTDYAISTGTFEITANVTLYAKWTQAVTLDANTANHGSVGGSATAVWNATALTGITHATPASGYKLLGYYTTASGDGVKVINSDGTFASSNIDGYITSGKWSRIDEAPTLYARYESSGSLIWNLGVNTNATSLTTSSKTSAFTQIAVANMTNAVVTGLTYTGDAKSNLTGKISTPASEDAGKYVSVIFQVADGYKFTPNSVKVKVQPISAAQYVKLELTDNAATPNSISYTTASTQSKGSTSTVEMTNGGGTYFTGTVTLKIFCYGTEYAKDGYRLGTPISIDGEVEELCATMPSFTQMNYTTTTFAPSADASGSPITIVGGENINTYQWKYNTTNDRTSGTDCGSNEASLVPLTDAYAATDGTRYYWCEMTNTECRITIKSPAVAITVAAAKSDATVTWTNPASTPNYGGGGYTVKATVNETGWNGKAADLTLSAPAGIRIYNIESGETASQKWVQASFDVTTAFDRETYSSTIPFVVTADATATYNAISDEEDVTFDACTGGGGEGSAFVEVTSAVTTAKTGMSNYWEAVGVGRLNKAYNQAMVSSADAQTIEGHSFSYRTGANNSNWMVNPYIAGVTKIRLYFYASAAIASGKLGISKVLYDTEYFSSQGSRSVVYDNVATNADSYAAADKGWIEFTLPEMAANSYCYFSTNTGNLYVYGVELFSGSVGSGGSQTTNLTWSQDVDESDAKKVTKKTTDAYFTITANRADAVTRESLGAITYSSSVPSVAIVDPSTGKVSMVAAGTTIIKATLAASGCFKKKEITYKLVVEEDECSIAAGTLTLTSGSETKCSSDNVTLKLTGFESGATLQWKDGDTDIKNGGNYTIVTDETTSTLTTNQPGTYSVIVKKGCFVRSNRITIKNASAEASVSKIIDEWYIKQGRLTPDIALFNAEGATSFRIKDASTDAEVTSIAGCTFELQDDVIYLHGYSTAGVGPTGIESAANETIKVVVTDACGNEASVGNIIIHKQIRTDKHVLAFVVNGTEKGDWTAGVTADQTTNVGLYNAIAAQFDVQATNIYATDDEKKLKEYYSQYDILCITDYPNTKTKGVNSKSYVDAIGALIDIRPILTMEAWVSGLANWRAKGISGSPKSPTTRQYTMDLQCKDHEIFAGTYLTKVGEGDEAMYRVSMVDNTKEEYVSLDATYGGGAHAEKEGYQYGKKPALQGFTFTQEMSDNDLLPIGLINDGADNPLQVGIERQHNMEARLMVLGINSYAMERLTVDGERVVINALNYLMKKNAEDIADCSTAFVGGAVGHEKDWDNADNWTGNTVPLPSQKVRILADCEVSSTVYAQSVLIVTGGKYNHGSDDAKGKLTIKDNGALIVGGKIQAASAPAYNKTRATTPDKLLIETSSTKQAALIFDNEEAETQATVKLYSLGRKDGNYQYQYFAVPMEVVPVNPAFANETHGGTGIYTYVYNEATSGWTRRKYYDDLFAFEGLGITTKSPDAMNYTMTGNLASTATKEITLTHDDAGLNLIGNSWMAPIQIGALAEDNTDANITKTVYIYCAGRDAVEGAATSGVTETPGQWIAIPFSAAEFPTWKATGKLSVIPAMQAFQIKVAAEATLTLDYKKVVRGSTNDLNAKLRAPGRRMAANEVTMTNIRVADSKTHTDLSLFEGDRFSEAFDNGWEADYMNGDGRSAKLYAETEAGQMAVAAMYDYEGTVVGFAPGKETEYTFSFMGEDNGYYLNDIKLRNSVRISEGETYTFTYEEGDAANRFYISRTAINAPEVATGMENLDAAAPKVQKIIYNDKLYIIRGGRLYDATGKVVK